MPAATKQLPGLALSLAALLVLGVTGCPDVDSDSDGQPDIVPIGLRILSAVPATILQ